MQSGPGYKRRRAITRLKPALSNSTKQTGAGGNVGLSNSTSSFHADSAIVCEILSRLPVKSLVRFKCVCKRWRLLIGEDSYFINLHLNQSKKRPKLFFIVPIPHENPKLWLHRPTTPRRISYYEVALVTVELMLEGRGKTTLRKKKFSLENTAIFGPVNGLIGYGSRKKSAICICNISTQEVSPWIESELSRTYEDKEGIIEITHYYEMGFDLATKKHKVICIWSMHKYEDRKFHYESVCEVLTVGDIIWRRIELPPFQLDTEYCQRDHTIYLNGFIYFCTKAFLKLGKQDNDKIVAFDIGAEKFRLITVPNFILVQPRHVYSNGN
ncbi:hypothetical protein MKW92_038690, partial [Papaver armeniacum]